MNDFSISAAYLGMQPATIPESIAHVGLWPYEWRFAVEVPTPQLTYGRGAMTSSDLPPGGRKRVRNDDDEVLMLLHL